MEKTAFEEYRKSRYDNQLKYYDDNAKKYKKRYHLFQWLVIVLSALTPVLAGLDGTEFNDGGGAVDTIRFKLPVVIISALVAILTTGLKTFNYMELWASYRSTQEQLKPEIHYYNMRVGTYATPGVDREQLFVARVEALLDKEHQSWPPAKKLDQQDEQENDPREGDTGGPNAEYTSV